jgi:hypothetical protein
VATITPRTRTDGGISYLVRRRIGGGRKRAGAQTGNETFSTPERAARFRDDPSFTDNQQEHLYTPADWKVFSACVHSDTRLMCETAISTGMRFGEITGLRAGSLPEHCASRGLAVGPLRQHMAGR